VDLVYILPPLISFSIMNNIFGGVTSGTLKCEHSEVSMYHIDIITLLS